MKILHLTGEFPPLVLGGLGTYVDAVAHLQAAGGDEVLVCVLQGEAKKYNTVPKPTQKSNVSILWRRFQPEKFVFDQEVLPAAAEIMQQFNLTALVNFKPDVVHVHDWYGALWGAALQQKLGVPLVFTSHLPTRAGFVYSGHSLAIKHKTQFEALGMRLADRVTVPSQFLADTLAAEYNVQSSKITVVPNGIAEEFFTTIPRTLTDVANQPIELLAVARLTEQKGLSYLIRAVDELKKVGHSVHCRIVGEGPLRKSLQAEIKRLNLHDAIVLTGFRDHTALRQLYQQADIFVSPSIYEPFGLVVLEAMAAGLPAICFRTGGIPEIITDAKFGSLVAPCDTTALSEAIARLIQSPTARLKIGQAGKKRARTFIWPAVVQRLSAVYHAIQP